jgi:uncharacterized membrane protein
MAKLMPLAYGYSPIWVLILIFIVIFIRFFLFLASARTPTQLNPWAYLPKS